MIIMLEVLYAILLLAAAAGVWVEYGDRMRAKKRKQADIEKQKSTEDQAPADPIEYTGVALGLGLLDDGVNSSQDSGCCGDIGSSGDIGSGGGE